MPEIMESESWIKTIRDPHAADFDFINASRSLIQLSSRSHVYIPVKIIESKLESESLEMLEVLLVLTSLVSRESDEKSREALSLQADNRLDFIKKLINLLLLDPHEKSVILKHYVDFILEETDFYRIKLASKYLWPHLESCNLYESLQKCGHEKVIFILFHVWKDIDPTPLYSCKWYWEYLSECLSESLASGAIKRALYLLRESNKDNLEVKSSLWNEYVNLIESLDEKQVHIIKPVLSKLSSFEKAFAKDLKWYFVIYRRLFKHQNLAIVHWSLNRFLTTYSIEDVGLSFFKSELIPVLNTSKLYHSDRYTRKSVLVFFKRCTASLSLIIKEIISMRSWGPIPLYFVISSIRKTISQESKIDIDLDTLYSIADFIIDTLTCMYPILQMAIKTDFLRIILSSTCPFPDVFSSVRGILKLFFKMNILSPKSACVWNSVKDWIKYIPFGSEPCDATVHERVLLCLLQDDSKQYALEKFSTPLLESVSRPYAPPTNNFETFILYLNYTEKIISPQDVDQFSVILRRRLDKIAVVTDLFEGFSIYLEAFHKLFDSSNQEQFIISLCKDYVDDNDIIKKYIKMSFIGSMDKRVSSVSNDICKWVRGKFPDILLKDSRKVVNRHDQKLWGTLECNYLRSQWALLSHYCMDEEIDWISCALASIDIGGEDVMLSIAECFVNLLNQMEEVSDFTSNIMERLLPQFKESVFHYQKNNMFKSLLDAFLNVCFHPRMIQHLPMETASYALSLLKSSESISIIADSLGHIFHENSFIVPTEWAAFIADMLIYGPIFRKDLALSMEVISMAMKDIETLNEDRCFPNIRVVGVKLAFLLPEKAQLIKLLWNQAIGGELEMRKRRHFENSSTHLIRNRAAQAILILMNELSPETTHLLFLNLIEEILNEDKSRQQQPSVKYLMEWMLSRILISNYDNLDFYDKFHGAYCVAKRTRLTVIPSFLVVFTQLALHVPSMKKNILDIIAPWLMGQIFATRISAQIGFNRIQPKSLKWKTLSSCLDIALFQGDEGKNKEKILREFYLNSFDALINWNFKDILYEFPRLCGILRQDWLTRDLKSIKNIPFHNGHSSWSFHVDKKLCYCQECSPCTQKTRVELEIQDSEILQDVQKKIVIPIEEDKGDQAVETAHPNLILVASLIDKLPNLGGLCRTSEIFGIGGLVLNCIKSAEEKEFQNLSVSSQNWVKLIEVRKENLTQWLKSMKEKEGYNLIGIEQTAQSLNLYEYMFPEKTIFVLGNEKEGVCPDVLRELDTTIEIPQYGVIRSFNVHVTGALVLAEYVRQRKSSINT
ncbi:probable methyltransferase TARBP1 [Lepeophtheirus salmonis]|uniref:probable methyltransferase TARBP1 n=1 Tax=Lepeophtheirus salmonis TaxID=72036 RepID=UPI001AE54380|nr:probable methyltransferase TARBP1 [Lepeophtheirus salmonis]